MKPAEAFDPRTVAWSVLASMLAAAAFFVLSTYAPDFRMAGAGGGTPLSKSAIGFAGLVELLDALGQTPTMARSDADLDKAGLLIVPLAEGTPVDRLAALVKRRDSRVTLFILPKWVVAPLPTHSGWDARVGHLGPHDLDKSLRQIADSHAGWSKAAPGRIAIDGAAIAAPEDVQWVADTDPFLALAPGKALMTRIDGQPHYVLADPDLLDNQGLRDPARAAAMLRVIQRLKPNDDPVMFDVTLTGAGESRSVQKLLLEPPFLAITLALLAAGALALAHGFVRFGPPAVEARLIAFGKYALTDTTARLFRRAGRLGSLGGRYAELLRGRAGRVLGAPATATPADLTTWLDRVHGSDASRFSALADAVANARTDAELQGSAAALHAWVQRRKR